MLQKPQAQLKKAAKKGELEKLIRIIRLIDQKMLAIDIFQYNLLVNKSQKREIKSNRDT